MRCIQYLFSVISKLVVSVSQSYGRISTINNPIQPSAIICKNTLFIIRLILFEIVIAAIFFALISALLFSIPTVRQKLNEFRKEKLSPVTRVFLSSVSGSNEQSSNLLYGSDTAKKNQNRLISKNYFTFVIEAISAMLRFWNNQQYFTRVDTDNTFRWNLYLSKDSRALVSAFIMGSTEELRPSLRQSFKVIGMQHVMAASGFNIAVVLTVAHTLIGRFLPRRGWLIFAAWTVWWYGSFLHWPASLVRASVMALWQLLARYGWGRPITPLTAIVLTLATTTICWPMLLADIGWQLSWVATASMAVWQHVHPTPYATWLLEQIPDTPPRFLFGWQFIRTYVAESVAMSVVIQLATAPLLWFHFQELNWLSIPATVLLGWLVPLITTLGMYISVIDVLVSWMQVEAAVVFLQVVSLPMNWASELFLWGLTAVADYFVSGSIRMHVELPVLAVFIWWICLLSGLFILRKSYQCRGS